MSIKLTISEIIKATGGKLLSGFGMSMVEAICIDPAAAPSNSLYVPVEGARSRSAKHIEDAFKKGAIAAFVRPGNSAVVRMAKSLTGKMVIEVDDPLAAMGEAARFWRQKRAMPLVGVTGDASATAIQKLAAHITADHLGTHINTESDIQGVSLCLAQLNAETRAAVYTLGLDNPDEVERLAEISDPTAGLISGTSSSAVKKHAALFRYLGKEHTALINIDDPASKDLDKETKARVLTFGTEKGDIHAGNIDETSPGRVSFDLHVFKKKKSVSMTLPNDSTMNTVVAAAAIAHVLGLSIEEIAEGLTTF